MDKQTALKMFSDIAKILRRYKIDCVVTRGDEVVFYSGAGRPVASFVILDSNGEVSELGHSD